MTLDVNAVYNQVVSHAEGLGVFERVLAFEPKTAPGAGLSAVIWLSRIQPVAQVAGLSVVSIRLELKIRVYQNALTEPQGDIDKTLLDAVAKLMNSYAGDFELSGEVMQIDIFGAYGEPFGAEGGYLRQDSVEFRIVTITLPIIISDVWEEVA